MCRTCKKPATLVGDWRYCGTCERPPPPKRKKPECELGQTINQHIASLTITNNVWRYGLAPKEGGDTKRRKRA